MRVPGLDDRPALAFAEHAGEHGERRRQPVPEVAGVRIGPGVEQPAGRREHGVGGDLRIVARRRRGRTSGSHRYGPPSRRARRGSAASRRSQRGRVGHGGGDVQTSSPTISGCPASSSARLGPRARSAVVVVVAQAGETQERGRPDPPVRTRPCGREPAVARDDLDVALQAGPARRSRSGGRRPAARRSAGTRRSPPSSRTASG